MARRTRRRNRRRGNAAQVLPSDRTRFYKGPSDPPQIQLGKPISGTARLTFKNPGPSSNVDLTYNNLSCALPGKQVAYAKFRVLGMSIYAAAQAENWIRVTSIGSDSASSIDYGSGQCSRPALHFTIDRDFAMVWQNTNSATVIARVVANKGTEFIVDYKYDAHLYEVGCVPAYGFSKEEAEEKGYDLVN